jgi:hypothetical protein
MNSVLLAEPVPVSTSEPSLSTRAMLSSLSISVWSARKHDSEASEAIAAANGADSDAGRYNKLLLRRTALDPIKKIVNEARQQHYYLTLPWTDNGYRVLPAAAYMDHTSRMRELSSRFWAAVAELEKKFAGLVTGEKIRLGQLFKLDDYPGLREEEGMIKLHFPEELRSKYSFETQVMPLPDADDFRVALGNEERDRVKKQITASIEASLQVAMRDPWQRLYEAVCHMAERLSAYKVTEEGAVENAFRDTLVTNLVKLVDVLPKLNITHDPNLDRLTEQVRGSLLVDPIDLRECEAVRIATARKADAIAAQMRDYMGIYAEPTPKTAEASV